MVRCIYKINCIALLRPNLLSYVFLAIVVVIVVAYIHTYIFFKILLLLLLLYIQSNSACTSAI